jgi:RsiW-degrading membrane proteinase PrsW (M82 family)
MLYPYTELLWAVIPPLLLLAYYYYRIPSAPSLTRLLFCFILGAISGFVALNLEWAFEAVANQVVDWQRIQRVIPGMVLRQLVEIGPIEEGCKLLAVIAPTYYLLRRYRFRSTSIYLFSIAVALGFTAEENWIYLSHGTGSAFERIISTPVHAMFSAPWGYALALSIGSKTYFHRCWQLVPRAWLNGVVCHALVNIFAMSGRYPVPMGLLSYGLFPFLVWMFWRLEQLLQKLQGKRPVTLISGRTFKQRFRQRFLVLLVLLLLGNAIFGLFVLAKSLSPLNPSQLFYPDVISFTLSRLLLNLSFGLLAWVIYSYLRRLAQRRYF